MLDLRLHRSLPAVLAAGILCFAAGCGGDDEKADGGGETAAATTPSPEPSATVSAQNPLDSANAKSRTKAKKGDPKRIGEREGDPELPASKGDDLEAARPSEKLRVSSTGADGTWRVSATLSDMAFCAVAATPGPSDPDPICADPTAAALTMSTSDGGTQVSVDQIRERARGDVTKLLVWGLAQRAVPEIKVVYRGQTKRAKISGSSLELKVDPETVKALGDDGTLKTSLNVRTFAVSFDIVGKNPPTNAVANPSTPDGGPVTLTLQ